METETFAPLMQNPMGKARRRQREVYEKVPGSGVWWVRHYDADGRLRRERVDSKSAAIKVYNKRRAQADAGVKVPEILKQRGATFAELAELAVEYVKGRYSRPADDLVRVKLLKAHFSGRAESITAGQIERTLDALTHERRWSASTRNHHHNLPSLCCRFGILHGKVTESPLRGLRRKTEKNSRVRFLTTDEEKTLRKAIRSRPEWAEHEPEMDLAMHTALRRSSMYLIFFGRTLT